MKHKPLHILAAAAACLMLGGCYETMFVPVYISDNTTRPSRYNIGQFDTKNGSHTNFDGIGIDASVHTQKPSPEAPAPKPSQPARANSGMQRVLAMLDLARATGHIAFGDDTARSADTLAAVDTLALESTDEGRVADWMLARIYEHYTVVVDYDRRSGTYSCRAYRRRE